MNETEKKVIRYIRNLRPIILHDGRLDLVETDAAGSFTIGGNATKGE